MYTELSSYFEDALKKHNAYGLDDSVINYLKTLLINGIRNEFLFSDGRSKYLYELHMAALSVRTPCEQFQRFKYLGDYSLMISGFFTESVNKKLGVNYYIDMGSLAYWQASMHYSHPYIDLSNDYIKCCRLLNDITIQNFNEKEMLSLYSSWDYNKNRFTYEKLIKLGLIIKGTEE